MFRRLSFLALALPAVLIARDAAAVRTPDYLAERPLEVAAGEPARLVRMTQPRPTAAGEAAWKAFTTAYGSWQGLWDASTGVPARIWGEGIAAPGANANPATAEAAARAGDLVRPCRGSLAPLSPTPAAVVHRPRVIGAAAAVRIGADSAAAAILAAAAPAAIGEDYETSIRGVYR